LRKCSLVGISYLGDYNYVREIERFDKEINTCSAYSREDIEGNKEKLDEYVRLKKSYDELLSEYNKSINAREKIEKWIWEEVTDLRKVKKMQDDIRITYKKYYSMAQNNPKVAMKFLENAYCNELDIINETLGEKNYKEFLNSLTLKEEV